MTANNTTTATTPNAPRTNPLLAKIDNPAKSHGVGEFLQAYPEAKRVYNRGLLARQQANFLHLVPNAGGRHAELGKGSGFDLTGRKFA
jgi:hypothetical protein